MSSRQDLREADSFSPLVDDVAVFLGVRQFTVELFLLKVQGIDSGKWLVKLKWA